MPRLFVAIDLPEVVKDELGKLCSGIAGARWVKRDQMHLTLRFIGAVDEDKFAAIKTALSGVEGAPFTMLLEGVGQFATKGKPRVLWVDLKAPDELRQLQQRIESKLSTLDLEPADHAFSPHITLARFKTPPNPESMRSYFARYGDFRSETIAVRAFILFSSLLSSQGAAYQREGVYELRD